MIFEIIEEVTIIANGFQNNLKTRFIIDFSLLHKTEDNRIYSIKKEKINTISVYDNNLSKIISELEDYNYPIKIKTDYKGDFLEIYDHENWLVDWYNRTNDILIKYDNSQDVIDIRERYYEMLKDKELFTKSKFKEPYWNLFFFNPPLDNVNNLDIGTILNWNIKPVGLISCKGRTTILDPRSRDAIITFDSNQKISEEIIEFLKQKTKKTEIKWDEEKVKVTTESHFNTVENKIKKKRAHFSFFINEVISYKEEIIITLKN